MLSAKNIVIGEDYVSRQMPRLNEKKNSGSKSNFNLNESSVISCDMASMI